MANGSKNSGEWKDSIVWNINRFDINGEIIEKIAKGKVVEIIDYREVRVRKCQKTPWVWLEEGNLEEHGRYQGQLDGLFPIGKGCYLSPLGVKYVGMWKDGLKHGTRSRIYFNGMWSEGEFREGKPWETVAYDQNRKLLFSVKKGRMIN